MVDVPKLPGTPVMQATAARIAEKAGDSMKDVTTLLGKIASGQRSFQPGDFHAVHVVDNICHAMQQNFYRLIDGNDIDKARTMAAEEAAAAAMSTALFTVVHRPDGQFAKVFDKEFNSQLKRNMELVVASRR